MSAYHQPLYWSTGYWSDYWAKSIVQLERTEPATYAPNSYYAKGYWGDVYFPVAQLIQERMCLGSVTMTVPRASILLSTVHAMSSLSTPATTIAIKECD